MENIEKYGNELVIAGFVVGNGEKAEIIIFPSAERQPKDIKTIWATEEELKKIFHQLDVLDITNNQKVVLRKSQRQLDAVISWNVFKRDSYKCQYCGNDHTSLTIDHLVLWEEGGDTIEGNLLTACKKCNHTRGSKSIPEFLTSDYYLARCKYNMGALPEHLITYVYEQALKLPLAKRRSR